ncbi:hypothetical protein [Bradyrhizobium sp. SZCCHNR2012]|uniref:hypothetical protein n=1 Tax=Bradyrhizobium sp. SZCCHNR2012 TaxID=3057377 RepID=UPI0028E8BE34|nr:hypothetical protein [Bradyrhizobium sp. SZCCHNR2012]
MTLNPIAERQADEAIEIAMEFAEVKLNIVEMADFAWMEVHRILGSQRARLLAGLSEQPHPDEMQRAAMGMCLVRFLENCRDHPDKAISWLRGRANGKA